MKKLALTGYYGMSNYGDDLFAISAFLSAKKYWPHYKPRILSAPLPCFDGEYGVPPILPRSTLQSHNLIGKCVRASSLVWNSIFVDKFIVAGGSVFHSQRYGARDLISQLNRRSGYFSAVGVSIGPFKNRISEEKIKEQLRQFEYISVRDRVSYERLGSYGIDANVVEAADLAGLIPLILPQEMKNARPRSDGFRIGFSPCFLLDRPELSKAYCDMFVNAIADLAIDVPLEIDLICLNQHNKVGDIELCRYTQSKLAQRGINSTLILYKNIGVLATWSLISELDVYFSVRLHGAVTAYLCGVRFFLFEYHEKCSEFLDFIGKSHSERASGDSVSREELLNVFRRVIFNGESCRMRPSTFSKLSEKNFSESPLCSQ